ncbi:hypothetical protein [Bosea sp. BIWAKO-01]|nr:hypothetical protein [Bosea sp. BIWAKO-01]GAU83185.1 hypothetical protein BIWAKO_03109 [Bosea sp. BIWAKO-01]
MSTEVLAFIQITPSVGAWLPGRWIDTAERASRISPRQLSICG